MSTQSLSQNSLPLLNTRNLFWYVGWLVGLLVCWISGLLLVLVGLHFLRLPLLRLGASKIAGLIHIPNVPLFEPQVISFLSP